MSHQKLPKHIMPESNDRALCFVLDGPMLAEEYELAGKYIDAMLKLAAVRPPEIFIAQMKVKKTPAKKHDASLLRGRPASRGDCLG